MNPDQETGNVISLEDALSMAQSAIWSQREAAARVLAPYAENPLAFEALARMLDDPDTAVIEASTASLTTGGGKRGLAEILKKLAFAEDNVGYHIRDSLAALWLDGVPVLDLCRDIVLSEPKGPLTEAAEEMIQELTHD